MNAHIPAGQPSLPFPIPCGCRVLADGAVPVRGGSKSLTSEFNFSLFIAESYIHLSSFHAHLNIGRVTQMVAVTVRIPPASLRSQRPQAGSHWVSCG